CAWLSGSCFTPCFHLSMWLNIAASWLSSRHHGGLVPAALFRPPSTVTARSISANTAITTSCSLAGGASKYISSVTSVLLQLPASSCSKSHHSPVLKTCWCGYRIDYALRSLGANSLDLLPSRLVRIHHLAHTAKRPRCCLRTLVAQTGQQRCHSPHQARLLEQ